MSWSKLWMQVFKRTEFLGVDMGFWVCLAIIAVIVIAMNVILWNVKPKVK